MQQDVFFSYSNIIQHRVFIAAALSWFSSQLIKAVICMFKPEKPGNESFGLLVFWNTGGMPSSHSAVVCALSVAIGIKEGFSSSLFVLSLFLALIVLRDALGIRKTAGEQARIINSITEELNQKSGARFPKIREIKGHTFLEVGAGMSLGILIGVLVSIF